jgi:hypothetical protein
MYTSYSCPNLWIRIAVGAKRMTMKIHINRWSWRSRRSRSRRSRHCGSASERHGTG